MTSFSVILLAAGESSRMGKINKLALPVAEEALLRRTAQTLLDAGPMELIVVVGHEQETVQKLLHGLPVQSVFNPDYREGQMTSVHCGMAALQQSCDAVVVCVSDLPLLTPDDVRQLVNALGGSQTATMVVPTYRGQRGNPVVLAYRHRGEILAGGRNLGCKHLIDRNPEFVMPLEMADDHTVFDVDTPEAYTSLQRRLGLPLPAMEHQ